MKKLLLPSLILTMASCHQGNTSRVPVIGFADAFQDETIAQAKKGFFDALADSGYSAAKGTVKVIYRNAEGDIPTLTQAIDYFVADQVNLIAANATLPVITAVQKTRTIPVCMMVAPEPGLAGLTDRRGRPPVNLFGVYETLAYIDTSVKIIREVMPSAHIIGTVFNQAEPQSRAALAEITKESRLLGMQLIALPVNSSAETQLVVEALLNRHIDVFFAMPDNTIFASFETIAKSCSDDHIPIFTSEAGLVKRGAVAAYGADIYQWGFQAGQQAAIFLRQGNMQGLHPEIVRIRRRIYNPAVAQEYHLHFNDSFSPLR
ncbi:MAG TPA: ABC transporter substrate-binding protein [Chitinophagaceae bacterium]|nr:ABC transporter substrate-binding protein [Chitinophagaceae bacterium]